MKYSTAVAFQQLAGCQKHSHPLSLAAMDFGTPLTSGTLIRRYKRFLADVELEGGEVIVAHCANSGSMMGLAEPGNRVWLSPNSNPKAKLDWRWEMVEVTGDDSATLVGINTSRPNRIVEAAIEAGEVAELTGYASLRREVKYGKNSRIDLLLEEPLSPTAPGLCYVEVKNVTLSRQTGLAEFPDAVTARGTKHLDELANMVEAGHRAVMFYLVQRGDCDRMTIAADIDPAYGKALEAALYSGVEVLCYRCRMTPDRIVLDGTLRVDL